MKHFTFGQFKSYSGRMLLFLVFEVLSVMFTMATVLSLADFLKILFEPEGADIVSSANGYDLTYWLQQFYLWLISFGKVQSIVMFSTILVILYACKNIFSYTSQR